MADRNLTFDIRANTQKLVQGMNKANNKISSFQKQLSGMKNLIGGVFAVGAIQGFISESVRLFAIQEKAEVKLRTALRGNITAYEELTKQAKNLQKVTLFGDEQTIEAQAQLAAMRLNADEVKRLTPLVQDLATLLDMNLADAAKLVAKSVGSSTNALSRYGIQIEGAVGSSDRLQSAMDGISKVAGGQAMAAALDTQTGKLVQLKNAWGDVKETIGEASLAIGTALLDIATKGRTLADRKLAEEMNKIVKQDANVKKYADAMFGMGDSFLHAAKGAEELTKRLAAPDMKEIFNRKATPIIGIRGTNVQGGVTGSGIGDALSKESLRETEFVAVNIGAEVEKIKLQMMEFPMVTEEWQSGLGGANSLLNAISGTLSIIEGKSTNIQKIFLSITRALSIVTGFSDAISSIKGAFGIGAGLGAANFIRPAPDITLVARGPHLEGTIKRQTNIIKAIGG